MGYVKHEALLYTFEKIRYEFKDEKVIEVSEYDRVRQFIDKLPMEQKKLFWLSPVFVNATATVVMVPDGSKEGWETSDEGDKTREAFLKEFPKAVHVVYGGDWKYQSGKRAEIVNPDALCGECGLLEKGGRCVNEKCEMSEER